MIVYAVELAVPIEPDKYRVTLNGNVVRNIDQMPKLFDNKVDAEAFAQTLRQAETKS